MKLSLYDRRIFVAIPLLFVITIGAIYSDERSAVWMRLYRRTNSTSSRLALMQNISRNPVPDLIPLLAWALSDLNAGRQEISSVTDRQIHNELTTLVLGTIGEVGAAETAEDIYQIVRYNDDPFVRGEAIFTLGRVGAYQYAEEIAIMLRNLNLNLDARGRNRNAEVVAYACLLALERFNDPVGYSPLFFASIGWYSSGSGVREKADQVMLGLLDDPTEVLLDIVRLEGDATAKFEALQAEYRSSAPGEGMAMVADEALSQGLTRQPRSVPESATFGRLRMKAMEMLAEFPYPAAGTVANLNRVMTGEFGVNEQIASITAMGALKTDDAVVELVQFLKIQNERQLRGVTSQDTRIVRAIILTLGSTGSNLAFEELTAVAFSNWPSAVVRDARSALDMLGR